MSDNYQDLGFDSIEAAAAKSTAELAIQWMISNGYICEALSDCVDGAEGGGHRPGPRWRDIVDEEETQRRWNVWSEYHGKPPPNAAETLGEFLRLGVNGVAASSVRQLCNPGSAWERPLLGGCPVCTERVDPNVDISALATRWWHGEARDVECPNRRAKSPAEDWDWQPQYAFAQASLTFWNWPPISAKAIAQLSAALGGVRIRRVQGHL